MKKSLQMKTELLTCTRHCARYGRHSYASFMNVKELFKQKYVPLLLELLPYPYPYSDIVESLSR